MNPRIYLIALGTFAIATDAFVIAGILPQVAQSFRVAESTAGQLVTVYALTYGLGAPLLAVLLAPISRRRMLIVALFGFSLANIVSAFSPSFVILLGSRVLAGVCAATVSPTSYALAAALVPDHKRGQAVAIVGFGSSAATIIGVPTGIFIGQAFGWSLTFGLIAGLSTLAAIVLSLIGILDVPTVQAISLWARFSLMLHPLLVLALLPTLFWSIAHFIVYTYVAPFLQQIAQGVNVSGMILVWGVGSVIGNWLGGYLVDHIGSIRTIIGSLCGLSLILSLLPVTAAFLPGTVLLLFLWGITVWTTWPALQNHLHNRSPHIASQVLALNGSLDILGSAVGAGVGGLVLTALPVQVLAWTGGTCALLALLFFLLSIWNDRSATKDTTHSPFSF